METLTFFTTPGLVKSVNEDVVGINQNIICICDGHWGTQAAILACKTLANHFPTSRFQAVATLKTIQEKLFKIQKNPDPPETSVLAIKINIKNHSFIYISYGDCRLLVSRKNRIFFSLPTCPTWLGALSHQKTRNRLSVDQATLFGTKKLHPNDQLFLFTDGVDECIYETPTIPHTWLIKHSPDQILSRIQKHGAQDNASLVIVKC